MQRFLFRLYIYITLLCGIVAKFRGGIVNILSIVGDGCNKIFGEFKELRPLVILHVFMHPPEQLEFETLGLQLPVHLVSSQNVLTSIIIALV